MGQLLFRELPAIFSLRFPRHHQLRLQALLLRARLSQQACCLRHCERLLVPGVGFSVEPGIYVPDDIGIRSEVNVHWGESGPEVTPTDVQSEIFLLLDD